MHCKGYITLVVTAVLLMMASCRHHAPMSQDDAARYCRLDSQLRANDDYDSLAAVAACYHDRGDAIAEALALKYQGRALRQQSRFDDAISVHERELKLATSGKDTIGMVEALNQIGTDYRRKGELSEANGLLYQALRLIDRYHGPASRRAIKSRVVTLNGIANIEIELRHLNLADSLLHQALDGERNLGSNTGMAINYANLGAIKQAKGEIDSAWTYFRESMKYNQLDGN